MIIPKGSTELPITLLDLAKGLYLLFWHLVGLDWESVDDLVGVSDSYLVSPIHWKPLWVIPPAVMSSGSAFPILQTYLSLITDLGHDLLTYSTLQVASSESYCLKV